MTISIKHLPFKRLFDIFFSLVVLIIGAPIFGIITLTLFFSNPGSPVYAHTRIGRGGRTFKCYKFRTMYPNADKILIELLESDPEIKKEWEKSFKLKKDPRVTPMGRFLRKTSLDELPQFWNVLIGDLSVVGPRPVVQEEITKYFGPKAPKILSMRPGLTGIWQISGRSDITCYIKRIQLDEYYVDNHSMILDLKVIAKTIPAILSVKGAY
jgi:exopolysaccharide production protein ExoY